MRWMRLGEPALLDMLCFHDVSSVSRPRAASTGKHHTPDITQQGLIFANSNFICARKASYTSVPKWMSYRTPCTVYYEQNAGLIFLPIVSNQSLPLNMPSIDVVRLLTLYVYLLLVYFLLQGLKHQKLLKLRSHQSTRFSYVFNEACGGEGVGVRLHTD